METEEVSVLPADVSSSPSGFLPQQRVVIMQLRNWKGRETLGEGRWPLGVASVLDPSVPPGAEPGGWQERASAAPQALPRPWCPGSVQQWGRHSGSISQRHRLLGAVAGGCVDASGTAAPDAPCRVKFPSCCPGPAQCSPTSSTGTTCLIRMGGFAFTRSMLCEGMSCTVTTLLHTGTRLPGSKALAAHWCAGGLVAIPKLL